MMRAIGRVDNGTVAEQRGRLAPVASGVEGLVV
jgi:hypothetical protein